MFCFKRSNNLSHYSKLQNLKKKQNFCFVGSVTWCYGYKMGKLSWPGLVLCTGTVPGAMYWYYTWCYVLVLYLVLCTGTVPGAMYWYCTWGYGYKMCMLPWPGLVLCTGTVPVAMYGYCTWGYGYKMCMLPWPGLGSPMPVCCILA